MLNKLLNQKVEVTYHAGESIFNLNGTVKNIDEKVGLILLKCDIDNKKRIFPLNSIIHIIVNDDFE